MAFTIQITLGGFQTPPTVPHIKYCLLQDGVRTVLTEVSTTIDIIATVFQWRHQLRVILTWFLPWKCEDSLNWDALILWFQFFLCSKNFHSCVQGSGYYVSSRQVLSDKPRSIRFGVRDNQTRSRQSPIGAFIVSTWSPSSRNLIHFWPKRHCSSLVDRLYLMIWISGGSRGLTFLEPCSQKWAQ